MDTVLEALVGELGGRGERLHLRRLWSRRINAPPSSIRPVTLPMFQSLGIKIGLRLAETWRFHSRFETLLDSCDGL